MGDQMIYPPGPGCCGISRRGFLLGAATGLATGLPLAWFGSRAAERWRSENGPSSFAGRTVENPHPKDAMPGAFPGRVIEVHHPGSVSAKHEIQPTAVKAMMERGMRELTGADHAVESWRRFFQPGDVVGIKVNPVGYRRPYRSDVVGAISSPAVLLETVEGLKSAGVKAKDIIVFERYASEFRDAGYEKVMGERAMDGVRWLAAGDGLDPGQLSIDGLDGRRKERDPHVAGYDPDVFVHMGFCEPAISDKDDRRFRSHLTVIVSRLINKLVTLPVLKDHRSAGITIALKNLSHGMNNNVARSHLADIHRLDGSISGPNQCNTFIPTAAGQPLIRQKATLHIMDGLIGVYEGGPGNWNSSWATWHYKSLFFATDPVAMDHVGWDIIDAKRAREGWQPVGKMGLVHQVPAEKVAPRLAALAGSGTAELLALSAAGQHFPNNQQAEPFDRRQPEHVILAETVGMGIFDARAIEHRRIALTA